MQYHNSTVFTIAGHLRDYVKAWLSQERIISLPQRFCDESHHILAALQLRIKHEEYVLYPKAEVVSCDSPA